MLQNPPKRSKQFSANHILLHQIRYHAKQRRVLCVDRLIRNGTKRKIKKKKKEKKERESKLGIEKRGERSATTSSFLQKDRAIGIRFCAKKKSIKKRERAEKREKTNVHNQTEPKWFLWTCLEHLGSLLSLHQV